MLRAAGVGVDRAADALKDPRSEITLRLAYLLGRLFLLAIAVILVRNGVGARRRADGAARDRVRVHDAAAPVVPEPAGVATMSKTRKVLLIGAGVYLGVFVLLVLIYGFTQHKNNEFQIQNEFKLVHWVDLGVFSINRAVLYLFIATILTIGTMLWISRRMQQRPNKIQTGGRGASTR